MRNVIKKLNKSSVKGLTIRNGSYFLVKCINGQRLNTTVGRVESMDIEEADRKAVAIMDKVRDMGLEAYKELGKNKYLMGHNQITMADVFHEFIEYVSTTGTKKSKGAFRQESINNYKTEHKLRWGKLLKLPIDKITDDHIETWFRQIEKEKNKDGSPKVSANFYSLTLLSRFFNWAMDRRYVEVNPCLRMVKSSERIEPQKKKSKAEERLSVTSDELGRFLFALVHSKPKQKKRNNDTARDLILMAIMTGARDTELKNLKWSWFDSTTSFGSYIAPAKSNDKNFEGTKGKRNYYYACSEIIQAMMKQRYANRQALAYELDGDAPYTYVFPNSIGTGAIDNVRKRIKNICEYAGIDKQLSMHSFRFTFSNIIEQTNEDGTTFSDGITKAVMHHKDSSITKEYQGDEWEDKKQIHKCFQHVEEFCSKAIGVGTVEDIFANTWKLNGVSGIALDNKSEVDNRVADTKALRNALYVDGQLQYVKIQELEDKLLKELFPNHELETWHKTTNIYNSMSNVKINKDRYVGGVDGKKDHFGELMAKRYKGKKVIAIVRHNPVVWINLLNNSGGCRDVLEAKYPNTYKKMFPQGILKKK